MYVKICDKIFDRKLLRYCFSINVFSIYIFLCVMNIINELIENSVCINDINVL